MHAFLVIGQDKNLVDQKVDTLIKDTNSQKMEFTIQKVAEVRELKSFLKINLPSKTAIVIQDFNSTSTDAQNALLKEIEEPQEKLIYILVANSYENILPTILSRCEVVEINDSTAVISTEVENEINQFLTSDVGDKFKKISTIKERVDAIKFMENILKIGHKLLLKNKISPDIIEETSKTLMALKANGNVSLQLTNFIVNLDS